METLKFKVGDKVRVKSLEWYNSNKNIDGEVITYGDYLFLELMTKYCGCDLIIAECRGDYYITEDNGYRWQDYMFEDEVITDEPATEEKQEIEPQDKETTKEVKKQMTKEEVFAYLNDTKILCTSTEESTKVQEKLFELGIEFLASGKRVINTFLLLIDGSNKLAFTHDIEVWVQSTYKQIEPSEILAIEIKEDKPKFDPSTLQPFDKVLVRDNIAGNTWMCSLFSHIEGEDFICTSSFWKCCIPYNEETKHLVGTTEEAPEFYQVWKK